MCRFFISLSNEIIYKKTDLARYYFYKILKTN